MPLFGPKVYKNDKISKPDSAKSDSYGLAAVSDYNIWKLISSIRNLSHHYKQKYLEYEEMATDVVIESALELYADDSTQMDTTSTRNIWVESSSKELQDDLQIFLDKHSIDGRLWDLAYSIAQYGDKYWKIHLNKTGDDIASIEEVDDPSTIAELQYQGTTMMFAEELVSLETTRTSRKTNTEYELYDTNSFVHFMIRKSSKCDTLELEDHSNYDENGNPELLKYKILRGTSLIEGVRSIYKILSLLEDTLLASRVARSEYVRVFNIEVGDSNPNKVIDIVNKVKHLFDSKVSMDIKSGKYVTNKTTRPMMDPIFNPVSNGKGGLTHDTIGGDFDVKSIVDVEYFNNKFFSGLKIPKAFLGFEESLPSGIGNDTLTRLDIRYARTVKRLQNAIILGIECLCNIWLLIHDRREDIGNFTIKLSSPSASEELGRLAEIEYRINSVTNITNIFSDLEGVNKARVIKDLIEKLIPYPELSKSLVDELEKSIKFYDKKLEVEQKELSHSDNTAEIENVFNPTGVPIDNTNEPEPTLDINKGDEIDVE